MCFEPIALFVVTLAILFSDIINIKNSINFIDKAKSIMVIITIIWAEALVKLLFNLILWCFFFYFGVIITSMTITLTMIIELIHV